MNKSELINAVAEKAALSKKDSEAAVAAAQELYLLAVVCHLAEEFAGFGIENNSSAGHVDNHVLSVLAKRAATGTALAVAGKNVAAVSERQQGPHVAVATEYYMTATAAVTPVRTSFGNIFCSVEMTRTGATLA